MKRLILCLFVVMVYSANVFGAAGDVSRVLSEKTTEKSDSEQSIDTSRAARRTNVVSVNKSGRADNKPAISRVVTNLNSGVKSGDVTSRGVPQNSVSRSVQKTPTRTSAESNANVVARSTVNSSVISRRNSGTAHIVSPDSVWRTRTARISLDSVDTSNNHNVQGRAVSLSARKQVTPTAESISAAKDILEKTADLNSTCQKQYNDCMDQFCAVVDANQKRCSCSENLARYAKVQQAVEDANAELNDVAQNIRYLGLSADEIRAIMNATEAELEISKTKDNTQTRSMLEDIADMIKDPTSSTSSWLSDNDSLLNLDLDFDFSIDSSDLFGLDAFSSSTNDISAKRGKDLYREATKRCKTVLTQCKEAGATESQISGNYDLAISKDCVAYEQGLEKLNQTLLSNVRSANLMLQKGRLAVLQNKNQYDIRGCVSALEACMLDDMVCGEDYIKCLDPTKNFIDENGEVILGRNTPNIIQIMQNYDNSKIDSSFIKNSMGDITCANDDGACIVNYLMTKIGTGQSVKDGGLCRAVLDKCQDVTYETNGKTSTYKPYNEVVVNYIQRALVNIRSAQTRIISNYASSCMSNISECYNQQVSQINSFNSAASSDSVYSIMTGACYNVALTCGYSVFAYDSNVGNAISQPGLSESAKQSIVIRAISDLFYQSLLCPSNSSFMTDGMSHVISQNRSVGGYVNTRCKCDAGYTVWGGACVPSCSINEYRNSLGACASCETNFVVSGGTSGNEVENSTCVPSGQTIITCPSGSINNTNDATPSQNGTIGGFVTSNCQCTYERVKWDNVCKPLCGDNQYRDTSTGECLSCGTGQKPEPASNSNFEPTQCVPDCPAHSEAHPGVSHAIDPNRTKSGYVTRYCSCSSGFTVWNGECRTTCTGTRVYRDDNGNCQTCPGEAASPSNNNMESGMCNYSLS